MSEVRAPIGPFGRCHLACLGHRGKCRASGVLGSYLGVRGTPAEGASQAQPRRKGHCQFSVRHSPLGRSPQGVQSPLVWGRVGSAMRRQGCEGWRRSQQSWNPASQRTRTAVRQGPLRGLRAHASGVVTVPWVSSRGTGERQGPTRHLARLGPSCTPAPPIPRRLVSSCSLSPGFP